MALFDLENLCIVTTRHFPPSVGDGVTANNGCSGELLTIYSNGVKYIREWPLDFCCPFHMYPNRNWFYTLKKLTRSIPHVWWLVVA